ncbi:MAG: hypothetical protein HOP06_07925 [Methylotenera sp.]|nr:hypothetical protein [Methylotenera sp.]
MKLFLINEEISEKLRELVNKRFHARGRFKELETLSGISASKWQNFLYRKQVATQELIQFWETTYQDYEFPVSEKSDFAIYSGDKVVSSRLREFISMRFQARGRFTKLESISGIKANKWKSFYYEKQSVSEDLLKFWCNKFPDTQNWVLTGNHELITADYPSGSPIPDLSKLTAADRLTWVINDWVALDGQQLFDYLAKRSAGKISADKWENVIQRTEEPTLAMLAIVSEFRPEYTEWVVRGHAGSSQRNPFKPDSN